MYDVPGKASYRDQKTLSFLVELAGKFIAREAGRTTLITPIRAEISPDHKNATVFVSVFPDSERGHALTYLTRNEDEFKQFMKKEGRFGHLPRVKFAFDYGEENRQHLDDLGKHL